MGKKLRSFFRSLYAFSRIYSRAGLLIFTILLILGFVIVDDALSRLRILELGLSGSDIRTSRSSTDLRVFMIAGIFLFCAYWLLFTIQVLYLRWRLQRELRKGKLTLNQRGNLLEVSFRQRPPTGLFFLSGQVDFLNLTAYPERRKVSKKKRLGYTLLNHATAFLHDKSLVYDLTHSPTGQYAIQSFQFAFIDPFHVFHAVVNIDVPPEYYFSIHHPDPHKEEAIFRLLKITESEEYELARQATEEFYDTREYVRGERLKKIHWKNTAKAGKLMMRAAEALPIHYQDVGVILNCYGYGVDEINQDQAIGRFLDHVIAQIQALMGQYHGLQIRLFFNTEQKSGQSQGEGEEVLLTRPERIADVVLHHAFFQQAVPYERYQTTEFPDGKPPAAFIFTLSSDVVDNDRLQKGVYLVSKDIFGKPKPWYQRVLGIKINLRKMVMVHKWRNYWQSWQTRRLLKYQLQRNEYWYSSLDKTDILNEEQ